MRVNFFPKGNCIKQTILEYWERAHLNRNKNQASLFSPKSFDQRFQRAILFSTVKRFRNSTFTFNMIHAVPEMGTNFQHFYWARGARGVHIRIVEGYGLCSMLFQITGGQFPPPKKKKRCTCPEIRSGDKRMLEF